MNKSGGIQLDGGNGNGSAVYIKTKRRCNQTSRFSIICEELEDQQILGKEL